MDNLKSSLNDVMKKRLKFLNTTVNAKVQSRVIDTEDVQEFLDSCKEFYNVICMNSKINFRLFVRDNNRQLYMLRSSLISTDFTFYQKSYSQNLQSRLTKEYRRIFIKIRYKQNIELFKRKATNMFTEFAKGITYFESEFQPERNPIYHRNSSCGSSRVVSNFRFTKTLFGPNMSEYVKRCLIERLLYDRIYEHTLRLQNIGHKKELQSVTIIYDSYFPSLSLKINQIDFSDCGHPTYVSIGYYNKDVLVIEETFTKGVGETDVYCTKTDYKNDKYYEKLQTFSNVESWMDVPKPEYHGVDKYTLTFE